MRGSGISATVPEEDSRKSPARAPVSWGQRQGSKHEDGYEWLKYGEKKLTLSNVIR
jgi:hypothetical protein